eukprot:Nitzschia sp. Nitz4//scaffold6_size259037//8384//9259//NITZ4_001038-RA/size259037-processed-gene-0.51-mRNA-1//-1//CDS//3329556785//7307//frame0
MNPKETHVDTDTANHTSRKRPPTNASTILKLKLQLQKKRKANIRAALEQAHRKLERAQQQKKQSLAERLDVVSPSLLSALNPSLDLTIHVNSSIPERAHFPCAALPTDLGLSLLTPEDRVDEPLEVFTTEEDDHSSSTSSLAQRKRQLQAELQVLKDRLLAKQQQPPVQSLPFGDGGVITNKRTPVTPAPHTRESLLQKKQEAKAMMDTSYWKLFVSKQQDWLEQAQAQVTETSQALAECTTQMEETQHKCKAAQQELEEGQARRQAVRLLIVETSKSLLAHRAKLCHRED